MTQIGFFKFTDSKRSERVGPGVDSAARRRESPLTRPIRWTEFPDWYATSKKQHRSSLRDLAKRILRTNAKTKDGLPWLKLAEFGDEVKSERTGCLRHYANMITISGVELDFDKGDPTWDQAWARLWEAGIPALLYTTRRHSSENHRFRVLLPLSRLLPPAERARLAARAYGVVRGIIDGASFVGPQSFYFGSAGGIRVFVELVDPPRGRYIDLADDLDAGALNKKGEPWVKSAVDADDYGDDDGIGSLDRGLDLERIKRDLSVIPSDERETWLRVGQALHYAFDGDNDGYELWDSWSESSDKYDHDDQRRVWDSFGSFIGHPVTIATIYRMAKQYRPATFGSLTFHTPSECTSAPPRGYLWKGMLARGDVASIFGAPGAGKSLIAPHLGYMIARGDLAFEMRTKPGLVFYVAAEDAPGLRQRVAALKRRHGDAPDFRVVGGVSDLFAEDSPDLEVLMEAVAEQRPVLIVIDTLAMAFPALEENDARSMGRVVAVARRLAEHGSAVLLVHHDTKAEGSTPRGHSILNGALDMAMHVKRDEGGVVRGRLTKNRNGSPDRNIAFRIGIEEFDIDEDGDPTTAAVAEEMIDTNAVDRVRLTGPESAALAKLMDMEAEGRVSEDDWRAACIGERKVSGAEDMNSRKRAMRRAVQGLAKKGQIETRNGFVTTNNRADSGYED